MTPRERTSSPAEDVRQELLAAARERLRRHLDREAGEPADDDVARSATAEVQAFLERLGNGARPP